MVILVKVLGILMCVFDIFIINYYFFFNIFDFYFSFSFILVHQAKLNENEKFCY